MTATTTKTRTKGNLETSFQNSLLNCIISNFELFLFESPEKTVLIPLPHFFQVGVSLGSRHDRFMIAIISDTSTSSLGIDNLANWGKRSVIGDRHPAATYAALFQIIIQHIS